jgi:hypothetical protein
VLTTAKVAISLPRELSLNSSTGVAYGDSFRMLIRQIVSNKHLAPFLKHTLQGIQRSLDPAASTVQDMGVDHGCLHTL